MPPTLRMISLYAAHAFFAVRLQSVRNEGALFVDVDMIEQVGVHEVTIALIILRRESFVLVQVNGGDFGKVQIPLVVPFDQLLVGTIGEEPVANPSTQLGFMITCAEMTLAAWRLISS